MHNQRIIGRLNASDYFSKIDIPDDWASLDEFVDWYVNVARMPLMIPFDSTVIVSDDATAICLFRKGAYQVELYLEHPGQHVLKHEHPNMEVAQFHLGGGSMTPKDKILNTSVNWGDIYATLYPGQTHGGDTTGGMGNGFVTLAFERWYNPSEMTSAAIQWKGYIHGPVQAALIRAKKKNALIGAGYADITKSPPDEIN